MANLYTGKIDTEGQYQTLASLTGLTFSEGDKYVIQVQGAGFIREGETGKGFYLNNSTPFTFTKENSDLYIKTVTYCVVNIAD